jgi:signal transduction histidine kinase
VGEEKLRALAERLRLAMAAGEMGSWEVDFRAGTLVWDAKQHEIFDRPPDAPPRNLDEFYTLLHPEDVEPIRRAYAEAADQPIGRFSVEFRITRRDGAVRWIAGQATTIADEAGQLIRVVGINYDVTELKEAQTRLQSFAEQLERQVASRTEQLVRSEEQLRAMAADLTLAEQRERQRFATELHDHLQQMLVFCKLKLARVKQLGPSAPEIPALHAEIDETLSRALTYSRSLVAELSPPVLRELGFASALSWLAEWAETLDLEVSVELGEPQRIDLPEAHAVLLFRSVRELLINAAKYAGTGRASVRLERSDGELRVTVSDEGRGFDPAAGGAAHAPATARFGLFSIRERMKTLGGSMHVESSPGGGTRATLMLPFVQLAPPGADAPTRRTLEARKIASRGTRSGERPAVISVLLVDDHAVVREGLRNVLSEYDDLDVVGEALDGADAVACVERLRPAVVVMDINMPRKNGIAATAEITARWPEVVVIGLSVNADRGNQEAMKRAGAAILLPKEAAVEDLYRSIQGVLNR